MEGFVRIETCAILVVVNNSKQTSEEVEEVVKLHSGHRLISVRIQHLCRKFAKQKQTRFKLQTGTSFVQLLVRTKRT